MRYSRAPFLCALMPVVAISFLCYHCMPELDSSLNREPPRTSNNLLGCQSIVRAVIQRVTKAQVTIAGNTAGEIRSGLCILLGVGKNDGELDADFLSEKIMNLRIFEDHDGKMNLSLMAAGGEVLIVSQFTLYGDWRKGNRPSFTNAVACTSREALRTFR
jgi:D-aminoacyl-tRNA deacylase